MSSRYRVALSGDFLKADGSPVFPDFDLEPLRRAPGVEFAYLGPWTRFEPSSSPISMRCVLLTPALHARQHSGQRLNFAVVARFGVGYDTVDVDACTRAGIALVITPDGVRRPVAVSIITLMLALTGKLMIKDALTREGPPGFARRGEHMGLGLVGRVLGSVGIGNIGAELFRLARPLDMRFIAATMSCAMRRSQESWASSLSRWGGLPACRRRQHQLPVAPQTRHVAQRQTTPCPDEIHRRT